MLFQVFFPFIFRFTIDTFIFFWIFYADAINFAQIQCNVHSPIFFTNAQWWFFFVTTENAMIFLPRQNHSSPSFSGSKSSQHLQFTDSSDCVGDARNTTMQQDTRKSNKVICFLEMHISCKIKVFLYMYIHIIVIMRCNIINYMSM